MMEISRRFTYTWDAENRLIGVTTRTDLPTGVPLVRVEYAYDHQGRRVSRVGYAWNTDHWALATDHSFLYDGWNVIAETIQNQQSTITNQYVWGLDLSGSLQGAGGIGGLLTAAFGGTTSVSSAFFTYDANGNVGQLVAPTGGILAHYEYSPFGETVVSTGPLAKTNPFRFSSKYWEDKAKLYYYGYRYYSPEFGRWTSRDPLAQWLHQRCYLFADNVPVFKVDAYGFMSEAICQRNVDRFTADPGSFSPALEGILAGIGAIEGCKPLKPLCICCDHPYRGYVDPSNNENLFICANHITPYLDSDGTVLENITQILLQVLVHENLHVLQGCRTQDKAGCAGAVCTEIQAALNDGRCQLVAPGNVRQCVIDGAVLSARNRCPRAGQAEEYAEAPYGQCNRPWDEVPVPVLPLPSW